MLGDVYGRQSHYCVMFISREYAERMWTNHERQHAQARALEQRGGAYILPVRVDDTVLPGLPPTLGYLSLSQYSIDQIADLLIQKLRHEAPPLASPAVAERAAPTTEAAAATPASTRSTAISTPTPLRQPAWARLFAARRESYLQKAQELRTGGPAASARLAPLRTWMAVLQWLEGVDRVQGEYLLRQVVQGTVLVPGAALMPAAVSEARELLELIARTGD